MDGEERERRTEQGSTLNQPSLILTLLLPSLSPSPGNLFFGNIEQLFLHLREVLHRMPHLLFLVLDTAELAGIDFSARDRLARMCKTMTGGGKEGGRRVHLVWAGLHKPLKEKLKAGGCFGEEGVRGGGGGGGEVAVGIQSGGGRGGGGNKRTVGMGGGEGGGGGGGGGRGEGRGRGRGWSSLMKSKRMHHFAKDLNKAFTFCEDAVLAALGAGDEREEEEEEEEEEEREGGQGRGRVSSSSHSEKKPTPPTPMSRATTTNSTDFLYRTLHKLAGRANEEQDDALITRLVLAFTREVLPAGATLWRRNDPSSFACIVQKGMLGVPRLKEDPSVSASLAQAPGSLIPGASTSTPSSLHSSSCSTITTTGRARTYSQPDVADDDEDDKREKRYTHPSYGDLLSISTTIGGGPGEIREYSLPGQMSGELGLFTRGLRKYTMVAVVETVVWRLEVGRLRRMREEDPQAFIVVQGIVLSYASHRLNCLMLQGQLHSV